MPTQAKTTTQPTFDAQEQYARNSQELTQRLVAAQTRNLKYTQSIFESTIALLKSHMEDTRSLLEQREQQGDSRISESYLDFFSAPIAAYQRMLEGVETVSKQSLESFQKATESIEHGNHATMDAARK